MGASHIGRLHGREVSARFVEGDGIHVDRADGTVSIASTAQEALAMVAADDARTAKRGRSVATRITWHDVPAGFQVPR